ncbi:MAG: hypothetical protein K0R38_2199 [Polyangiaceae bacterium]|jgi:hypothetical protein|nr:hypothetical protein [Polyangiaceae bacterium]
MRRVLPVSGERAVSMLVVVVCAEPRAQNTVAASASESPKGADLKAKARGRLQSACLYSE